MSCVSVIVPVFNVEKYLSRCLNSIIKQSFKDTEIIIINDGSTDNCHLIIEKFVQKDNRIIYINQENSGVSFTRNEGIKVARGKYLCFVDSDDWIEADFIEHMYKAISMSNADVCINREIRLMFDDGTSKVANNKNNSNMNITEYKLKEKDDLKNYIFEICCVDFGSCVCNKLYLTKIIKINNILFQPIESVYSEDCFFNLIFALHANKAVLHNRAIYNYFIRNDSFVQSKRDPFVVIKGLDNLYNYLVEYYDKLLTFDIMKEEFALFYFNNTYFYVSNLASLNQIENLVDNTNYINTIRAVNINQIVGIQKKIRLISYKTGVVICFILLNKCLLTLKAIKKLIRYFTSAIF